MKKYILPVIAALLCCSAANAFELDDFVLGGARVRGIPSSQPALDGRYYYQFNYEGTQISKYSYKKEKDVTTFFDNAKIVDNPVKSWDGYTMSSDEKSILLWNNSNPIYRYSFTADHYIYNIKENKLERLSNAGGEEIATLSPDGSQVAYVKDNNVFVKNLASGVTATVTTDGKKNNIINAVPDWVYQEEFGVLNTFAWSARWSFIRASAAPIPTTPSTRGATTTNIPLPASPTRW